MNKETQQFSGNPSNRIEIIFRRNAYVILNVICFCNVILLIMHVHVTFIMTAIISLAIVTMILVYSFFIPPIKTDFPYPRALFVQ